MIGKNILGINRISFIPGFPQAIVIQKSFLKVLK